MPNQVREMPRSQPTGYKQSADERGRSGTCDGTECVGGLSRAEAFSLLGNEDRLAILECNGAGQKSSPFTGSKGLHSVRHRASWRHLE